MSTRCTIHFHYGTFRQDEPAAIVYRHSDGYPETVHGVPESLERFFDAVEEVTHDTRFDDPCYLAAKFVIWQAQEYSGHANPLATIGVGVCQEDPGDIRWRYHVRCNDTRPTVDFEEA